MKVAQLVCPTDYFEDSKKITPEETKKLFPVLLQQGDKIYLIECGQEETTEALE